MTDTAGRKHYPTTLFTAAEAYHGACTAKSTIYCANVAAGIMVGQFAKWLRGMPAAPTTSCSTYIVGGANGGMTLHFPLSPPVGVVARKFGGITAGGQLEG